MDVTELAGEYRRLILEKRALFDNPLKGNKLVPRMNEIVELLKSTRQGRATLSGMMKDPEVGVRLNAAVDSWQWDKRRATRVLEAVMKEPSFDSVSARYALKGLREGTR